jgi:Homeodomain-like domain
MVMVGTDPVEVERALRAGELLCPGCSGVLRPWGHARWRSSRGEDGRVRHRPRRSACSGCAATHVLLPATWLPRRADAVTVIGAALLAKAAGRGHRPIAAVLGRPPSTVRGWLRRFAARAEEIRVWFTRLLYALDPEAAPVAVTGSGFADVVEAMGRAASAAVVRLAPGCPWEFAARASGGRLLAPVSSRRGVAG